MSGEVFREYDATVDGLMLSMHKVVPYGCIDRPVKEPDNENCPRGEWYCQNEECVVRDVEIYCKLYGEEMPQMDCPACGVKLKFHHWLESTCLVYVTPPSPPPGE